MTYLTESRDTLTEALLDSVPPHGGDLDEWWQKFADALIASGVVIDASTLADDEALVDVIATHTPDLVALAADGVSEGEHLYCVECGVLPGSVQNGARHVAAQVAAALTERGGVGTGAGEGAPRQDTGSAWVTRSADCPEAPAQAHTSRTFTGTTHDGTPVVVTVHDAEGVADLAFADATGRFGPAAELSEEQA